jgi:polar amino acid transport system substrate-binding protein
MNTLKRWGVQLLAGVLLATAVAAPASAQSPAPEDDWAKVKAAGKILVGTAADYPPFEFYASNYQLDGFDIVLMKEIGKRLGIEVEFNDFAFEGVLDALRLKQVDAAIAGISVTDKRREQVDFSNIYYIGKDAALIRTADQETIKDAQDLAGKKIGVQKGTTFQSWVQDNLVDPGLVPQANVLSYANVDTMVTDLRERKTDVVIMGESPARVFDRRFRDITVGIVGVNPQRFAIASRNGSTLSNQFNSALLQIQSDGTFAKLVDQYLNVDPKDVTAGNDGQVVNEPTTGGETAPAPCINGMAFVADVNLDDKNMTAPPVMKLNQQFTKTWRVRNSGTCAWDPKFVLAFAYGNRPEAQMGGTQVAVGRAVQPGETIDISANLTAPNVFGVFQGFWTMRDLNNVDFGETVWVGIQVPNPNPPPPPTAPPPPPRPPVVDPIGPDVNMTGPNLRADAQFINAGQCTTVRWEAGNVNGVFFVTGNNVEGVGGVDSRVVCPPATTTYVLRVLRRDGVTQDFPITINVQQPNATINFWADTYSIQAGQCTVVRWDVQGVQAVFYNEQGVPGQDARQECPGQTTTYNLRVVLNDGSQQTRQVTIQVVGGGSVNPTPIP